jgi:Na+/proline symporter
LSATTIGAVVFGLYLIAIIALGLIASRYQKTEADFWVAGRRYQADKERLYQALEG